MLFIVAGVLAGVFVRYLALGVLGVVGREDPMVLMVPATVLAAGVIGIATTLILLRTESASAFTDSVVAELKRVTWPSREETISNTGIVVGAAVFFATLLSAYDFLWMKLTGLFLFTTG